MTTIILVVLLLNVAISVYMYWQNKWLHNHMHDLLEWIAQMDGGVQVSYLFDKNGKVNPHLSRPIRERLLRHSWED